MLLDDDDFIEDETRRSLKILLEEQQKFITVICLLIGAIMLCNTYHLQGNETFTIVSLFTFTIVQVIGTALITLILTLFINLISYKNFTYQERFVRTYLILLMVGYILVIISLLKISI